LPDADLCEAVRGLPPVADVEMPILKPGQHYARMWRGPASPPLYASSRREFTSAMQATRNLVRQMRDVFRCVEPASQNLAVFGHEIRQVLILACTEVEAAWKAVLRANAAKGDESSWATSRYVKLLKPLLLDEWEVALTWYPSLPPMRPFVGWASAKPTKSLPWYDNYNKVKHDRETSFECARLDTMITAVGAAIVLLASQFGTHSIVQDAVLSEYTITNTPTWPLEQHYVPPWLDPNRRNDLRQARRSAQRREEDWVPPWDPVQYPNL
jgi:hypothetical protein